MSRGGPPTYLYSLPAVYLAVPGTTILAVQHNSPLEDIADTLNDPWPVNIGGTGGTSAITSWDAINSLGTAIPTAASLDLDASTGANLHLTGAVTVTSVSLTSGRVRQGVIADSAFLITASASLVVNGYTSGNIQVPAGAVMTFVGGAVGVVYVAFTDSASASFLGYTTTATAAGTTTLTAASTYQQYFTGVTTQTITLPVTSTLNLGFSFRIVNNSTGVVTVNSSGANAVVAMLAGTVVIVTCILTSGTTAASWSVQYLPVQVNANNTQVLTGDGTVSLPAHSFASDPDSGTYRIGANNLGIGVNGAKVLDVSTTGLGVVGTILNGDGTFALPAYSFTADPNTGMYRIGADNIGLALAGLTSWNWGASVTTYTWADDGATVGPLIDRYRISTTAAANDIIGGDIYNGRDSAGNKQEYASTEAVILDPTTTAEDGALDLYATIAAVRTKIARFGPNAILLGTPTNDSAAAGMIGEYIESDIASGSAVALTTNTSANVSSISLTAGDWDVQVFTQFLLAATTNITRLINGASTTSATLDATTNRSMIYKVPASVPAATTNLVSATMRFSLSATTTVYHVANAVFTVSTASAYGYIRARRVR